MPRYLRIGRKKIRIRNMFKVFQSPKSGKLRVEDVPAPRARRGGVVVHNKFSVISAGTEKMIIELSKKGVIQKAKERPDYVQKFITVIKTKGISARNPVLRAEIHNSNKNERNFRGVEYGETKTRH